jgi:hypothetical protein
MAATRCTGAAGRFVLPRRIVLMMPTVAIPWPGRAQPPANSPLVGIWRGVVPDLGEVQLTITAGLPNGLLEGKMEVTREPMFFRFADVADTAKLTNRGAITGDRLRIDAAYGGFYELKLQGPDQLVGTYNRELTYNVAVKFTKQ